MPQQNTVDGGNESSNLEYVRWACEQLIELLGREEDRRRQLEAKAIIASSAVVAIGAFCIEKGSNELSARSCRWWLLVVALLFTLGTLFSAWTSLRVRAFSDIEPEQLAASDVLGSPPIARFKSLAEHLSGVLSGLASELQKKADRVRVTLEFALVTVFLFLVFVAM